MADLTFDPLFLPQPKSPPVHTPASPVPMSHVSAGLYLPQAQPPNPHTLNVPHLVSESHALAHSIRASPTLVMPPASPILHVPSGLHTGHALHIPATPGAPYEAKKAQSIPELDRLLDVFIRQLEDKMTSTGPWSWRLMAAFRTTWTLSLAISVLSSTPFLIVQLCATTTD